MSDNTVELNNDVKQKDTRTRKKKEKKKKKRIRTYIKETKRELKQVSWSSRKETLKNTGTVLLVVGTSALLVYGMDSLLSFSLKALIK